MRKIIFALALFFDFVAGVEAVQIKIKITNENGKVSEFSAKLVENSATKELLKRLNSESLSLKMVDYSNFEKYAKLPFKLPQSDEQITTKCGDVMLAWGDTLAIYYDKNSYSFTRIGQILGVDSAQGCQNLKSALGAGDVNVVISKD